MIDTAERKWITVESDDAAAKNLAAVCDIPLAIAHILASRGYRDPDAAQRFMDVRLSQLEDPFLLPDMQAATDRIWRAIEGGEDIVIFGDYDADGVTSTALLLLVLRELGATCEPFLPSRHTDGYGLTVSSLERCAEDRTPQLIVTVDCGTSSVDAVVKARELGVDVVVTDHHETVKQTAPAVAVVNPKLGEHGHGHYLAGVGVAFKLCHALVQKGREQGSDKAEQCDLRKYLDLVALGTVADVVPLLEENRALVHNGLDLLNRGPRAGIAALIRVAGVRTSIDCYHLGFLIGPRLNAAGRLGEAKPALDLLLSDDPTEVRRLAGQLDAANRERKRIEEQIIQEATGVLEREFQPARDFAIVASGERWHVGTIGIVAARLCGRYHRPSVVISFDEEGIGTGSCRSIDSVDMASALSECADLLIRFGGHKMAAGLTIQREDLEAFRERFNAACCSQADGEDLVPTMQVDAWLTLGEADYRLLEAIDKLRPMGLGNPTPIWGARGLSLVGKPRVVGKNHLKMVLACGGTQLDAIAFGMAGRELPDGPLDILFHLQENNYLGKRSVQLNVKDFRPATAT